MPRTHAWALVVLGALVAGVMCALSARGVEPVATWLYPFAWYPLLLALEGGIALRHGRFLLLDEPRLLISVLAWSVPLWMLWEVLNFRVENWYYVFVPDRRIELWAGVILSFGTVLPACFLPAALLWPRSDSEGAKSGARPSPPTEGDIERDAGPTQVRRGESSSRGSMEERDEGFSGRPSPWMAVIRISGLAMLVLPMIWPRFFFPLIWGGFVLLAEPALYRRAPSRSLLADVVAGRSRRIVALLVGGALAGLAWEALNSVARGQWIYTVPWFEELKLFEMPGLGFLGFPPLALSCFSLYQWLALRGWAVPLRLNPGLAVEAHPDGPKDGPANVPAGDAPSSGGDPEGGTGRRSVTTARSAAIAFVAVTLLGMEAWTIASRTPRLRDLPGLLPSQVETLRVWGVDSPFALAKNTPGELVARVPGVTEDQAEEWIDIARLTTTRGIGTRNARLLHGWGVRSLEELAGMDPDSLAARFRASEADLDVRPPEVRVWWRAAREATDGVERVR
ncbi:MAG: DUF4332 domain-containing protein [Gemmatimonadota bacterium]